LAIASRQRVAKERAARSVAAEFVLASAVIKVIDETEEPEDEESTQQATEGASFIQSVTTDDVKHSQLAFASSQGLPGYSLRSRFEAPEFSLPFHSLPLGKGKEQAIESITDSTSHPDVFSPPSYTPSQASISHASFAPGHSESSTRAVVGRLSRLCEIRKPPSGRNPRPTTLLAHWATGQDPVLYNWRDTIVAIEKAQEEAVMTPAERQRVWKKRQRKERQKRKEEEKWRTLQAITSSQPVVLDSRVLEEEERMRRSQSRGRSRSMGRTLSRGTSVGTVEEGSTGRDQKQKQSVVGVGTSQLNVEVGRGNRQETVVKSAKKRKKRTSGF
jgi:hypothetical protein